MSSNKSRVCPICNKTYFAYPAISRVDDKTEICPSCGTKEAMVAAVNSEDFQRQIKSFIDSGVKAK